MGKKKNNNNNNKENDNNGNKNEAAVEKKKNDGGGGGGGDSGEKKTDNKNNTITVVLKVDMHCEGCASKIVKCVRSFEGVESVKAEMASNKITIVGAVDPSKIRDNLEKKTKKKIDLVSPQPNKKDNKEKEPKQEDKPKDKPADDKKKPKEAPVTTAVLKLGLHCQGCIEKIQKIVSKTKGVIEMSVDKQKDLVTVRGTMDAEALTETLKERLKRPVEIVPPKNKEKETKESNGGKKNKGGGGADGDKQEGNQGGGKMEGNRIEYFPMGIPGPGHGYGYQLQGGNDYGYGYPVGGGHFQYPHPVGGGHFQYPHPVGGLHHAPQMFSDENPNACSVM